MKQDCSSLGLYHRDMFYCELWNDLKTWAARNFARYDSLVIILARFGKNSPSLSLAPFLARCRSLSLSLRGLLTLECGIKRISYFSRWM